MNTTPPPQPNTGNQRSLLDPDEASAYVRMSTSSLAKLRVYGGGPRYFKVGRRVYYDRADLNDWLDGRIRSNTSDAGQ